MVLKAIADRNDGKGMIIIGLRPSDVAHLAEGKALYVDEEGPRFPCVCILQRETHQEIVSYIHSRVPEGCSIDGVLPCDRPGCNALADYRYKLPGVRESFVCEGHVPEVRALAKAAGEDLEMSALGSPLGGGPKLDPEAITSVSIKECLDLCQQLSALLAREALVPVSPTGVVALSMLAAFMHKELGGSNELFAHVSGAAFAVVSKAEAEAVHADP